MPARCRAQLSSAQFAAPVPALAMAGRYAVGYTPYRWISVIRKLPEMACKRMKL
jgi:hypothetical protein